MGHIPIPTRNNLRIGTLRAALIKLIHCSLDILRRRILGQEILREPCGIEAANALAARIASKLRDQAVADFRSDHSALRVQYAVFQWRCRLTVLPSSVEPRAKMNMTSLQFPVSTSLAERNCRWLIPVGVAAINGVRSRGRNVGMNILEAER